MSINQTEQDVFYLKKAIEMAVDNVKKGRGGPFAAIIVQENEIVASGTNLVTSILDPTAHAEITAIRNACQILQSFHLDKCTIYASCEPCPMCLGAIYWAHCQRLVFTANKNQAAAVGFDDAFIYQELQLDYPQRAITTIRILLEESNSPFENWTAYKHKIEY